MELDNREIAFLAWLTLIAGIVLWRKRDSKPLRNLIKLLFSRPILYLLGAVACYIATSVWLLSIPGWWQWSNLKTALLWTCGFALAAIFNYRNVENGKAFLVTTALEVLGINAILAFISSSYTFSLTAELVIAGAIILLAALSAISEQDVKLKPVNKTATVLLISLSVLMLGNSLYHIATGFGGFATSHTAREFGVPILLTLMFLPFLYGIYVLATYQYVFYSFDFSIKDPTLRRHARRRLLTKFLLDPIGLEKWRVHVVKFTPKSTAEIDEFIEEIKRLRKRERRPYRVPPPIGWLPNDAINFLVSADLKTESYHRTPIDWSARSDFLTIGDGAPYNNVAYSVEGDEFVVSKLQLQLNMKTSESSDRFYECFFCIVSLLVNSAIPAALRSGNELSIGSNGEPLLVNGYRLSLEHNEWPSTTVGGHDLVFTIEADELAASPST